MLWSFRGQALVGQLGSQSLLMGQREAPPGIHAALPEPGTFTFVSFRRPVGAPPVHSSPTGLSVFLPVPRAGPSGAGPGTRSKVGGHWQCIP